MPKALVPTGDRNQLGTPDNPWLKGYFGALYGPGGDVVLTFPLDASAVQSGVFNPARINNLNSSTDVDEGTPGATTLAAIIANALLGAIDPVIRINAGGDDRILGTKIEQGTTNPNILDPGQSLVQNLTLDDPGQLISAGYVPVTTGFRFGPGFIEINLATAIWRGIIAGTIAINQRFNVDVNGNFQIGDPTAPAVQHGIDNDGKEWWGADEYVNAQCQVDKNGNFFLSDSSISLSSIDPGAISTFVSGIIPSQAGGLHPSGNIALTTPTRGASMYYTLNGVDPLSADGITPQGTHYGGPFAVTVPSGTVVLRARAYKLGHWSTLGTWTFTASGANALPNPMFSIPAGFYTTSDGILHNVAISVPGGPGGESIKYTIDGTTPSGSNGIPYVGPINLTGTVTLRAYATKSAWTDSGVTSGNYSITRGGGNSGGGGGGHDYQR